jgi:hypothetical protein
VEKSLVAAEGRGMNIIEFFPHSLNHELYDPGCQGKFPDVRERGRGSRGGVPSERGFTRSEAMSAAGTTLPTGSWFKVTVAIVGDSMRLPRSYPMKSDRTGEG